MSNSVPIETLQAFARTIYAEACRYGFGQLDFVRLINEMMDLSADAPATPEYPGTRFEAGASFDVTEFPLRSPRLAIRPAEPARDRDLLKGWLDDNYGRHFLLSCATAQHLDTDALFTRPRNDLGIVSDENDQPIGAVAYLDIDTDQRRAELRKLIGEPSARGKGYAEEATRLWLQYGRDALQLDKVYVSTLQTHLRNIQLNESIGFRVEGLLQREVLIGGTRYDVLRMGLCFDDEAADSPE